MKPNRSVMRLLQAMDYLAEHKKGAALSEIAHALGEPKTSVYDLLVTAVNMKYLRRHNRKFYIGKHAKIVGDMYQEKQALLDIVTPTLKEAVSTYNVSVSLVFLEYGNLNYCFSQHPDDAVLVARQDAPYNFIHASASGKVLLAWSPPERRAEILATLDYRKFTDRTISNETSFLEELERVRSQGYAVDNREYHYLLQCISAPVRKSGEVIASCSFSGLNLFLHSPEEMAQHVVETANQLSAMTEELDL